ncbi:MAG TPA: DNA-processing protein DprA [Coriobacteriia bacterium]
MSGDCRFVLRLGEDGYPAQLAMTPRPPRTLYGIGDASTLCPGLAIIGSRKATPYGLDCAAWFARRAAREGVVVISGAAMGCDQAAQRAALEAGGRSVAVLGCGADIDYPARARDLLDTLRSGAGVVVSEFPWGMPPARGHFPARNRIIAGLSSAVLVVEAALPSGTFSTADHALEAGRDVLAVPGSVFFSGSAGCNRLIRQGAAPVCCDEDLLDSLWAAGLLGEDTPRCIGADDERLATESTDPVLRAILAEPVALDRLVTSLGLDAAEALRAVALLESAGAVARYPDGRYGPCMRR